MSLGFGYVESAKLEENAWREEKFREGTNCLALRNALDGFRFCACYNTCRLCMFKARRA